MLLSSLPVLAAAVCRRCDADEIYDKSKGQNKEPKINDGIISQLSENGNSRQINEAAETEKTDDFAGNYAFFYAFFTESTVRAPHCREVICRQGDPRPSSVLRSRSAGRKFIILS